MTRYTYTSHKKPIISKNFRGDSSPSSPVSTPLLNYTYLGSFYCIIHVLKLLDFKV